MKPRFVLCLLAVLVLCLSVCCPATAEGTSMRVINCNEWVSLWAKPSNNTTRLVKVPLGAIVTNCSRYNKSFTVCEYNGHKGYIRNEYLEDASLGEAQSNGSADLLIPVAEEGSRELGTMKVINCEEWVSLWKKPSKNADRILKVGLGSFVYNCSVYNDAYIKCEYNGITGYILSEYLEKADATAPVAETDPDWYDENVWVTSNESQTGDSDISSAAGFSYVELVSAGETELEERVESGSTIWFLYGIRVKNEKNEQLLIGCFNANLQPVWCRSVISSTRSELQLLSVFTGGTEEVPYAMIYNAEKGLQAVDIATGNEVWHISSRDISLGASVCHAVDTDGTLYIAGHNGPHPVAISVRGGVMWAADPGTDEVYGAYRITLNTEGVLCDYESSDNSKTRAHHAVLYSYYGETLDIQLSFTP